MILYTKGDKPFYCTTSQAETLDRLAALRKGGIGTVHGYIPSTGWVEKPVVNIQGIFRVSVEALYTRRMIALNEVAFADVADIIANTPKLSAMPIGEARDLFNARKAMQIESLEKSLSGDRSDGHRQGHDICYARVSEGIKVNLKGEKDSDGLKNPILKDGHPIAESIMLGYLELSRSYVKPGTRKVVNSGAPVLMGNAIEEKLNKRSVQYRTLSLKEGNFDHITVDRETITADALSGNEYGSLILEMTQ